MYIQQIGLVSGGHMDGEIHACRQKSQAQKLPCFCRQGSSTSAVGNTINEKASSCIIRLLWSCLRQQHKLQDACAGSGTVVYSNKDKYEGDWLNGKRHGVGALWLYDSDRYRIRYTGEWHKDKFHVRLSDMHNLLPWQVVHNISCQLLIQHTLLCLVILLSSIQPSQCLQIIHI